MRLDNPAACHDAWMNLVKEVRSTTLGLVEVISRKLGRLCPPRKRKSSHEPDKGRVHRPLGFFAVMYAPFTIFLLSSNSPQDDFDKYWSVYDKLISPISTPTRNIPLRVYIPGTGSRVIQRPVPPLQASRMYLPI